MVLNSPSIFTETKADSWRFAAAVSLLLAVLGLWISPQFSVLNLAGSMAAGLLSFLAPLRAAGRPLRGVLAAWVVVIAALWLSSLGVESVDSKRAAFAVAAVYFSLAYQGSLFVCVSIFLVAFGFCLPDLAGPGDFNGGRGFFNSDSFVLLLASIVVSFVLVLSRFAHSRAEAVLRGLRETNTSAEATKLRLASMHENLYFIRESLLGRSISHGEAIDELRTGEMVSDRAVSEVSVKSLGVPLVDVIRELRNTFADYQTKGRAEGRIAGPVRFVFFPPVAGFDERSVIAVDLGHLRKGVEACLGLAHDSLPEVGALKREGVIRLSIRCGLSALEVCVEDNGRGLAARHVHNDFDLVQLKASVEERGGKFDRVARLGVGSRSSFELRILRERVRAYRPTLGREFTTGETQAEGVPHG